jgi:hypothetical protein
MCRWWRECVGHGARPMVNCGMRRSLLTWMVIAFAFAAGAVAARAQSDPIQGPWQQIQSNAGACPACRLSIEPSGASLMVTANNGWSATITARQHGAIIEASGAGRWNPGVGGGVAGKAFHADFVLREQRLYMTMSIDMPNGSRRIIKGVFGRVWVGA